MATKFFDWPGGCACKDSGGSRCIHALFEQSRDFAGVFEALLRVGAIEQRRKLRDSVGFNGEEPPVAMAEFIGVLSKNFHLQSQLPAKFGLMRKLDVDVDAFDFTAPFPSLDPLPLRDGQAVLAALVARSMDQPTPMTNAAMAPA